MSYVDIHDDIFDALHDVTVFDTSWGQWQRKFAWTKTVVNNEFIRFKFYYYRTGVRTSNVGHRLQVCQTASDLFDVLKRS